MRIEHDGDMSWFDLLLLRLQYKWLVLTTPKKHRYIIDACFGRESK